MALSGSSWVKLPSLTAPCLGIFSCSQYMEKCSSICQISIKLWHLKFGKPFKTLKPLEVIESHFLYNVCLEQNIEMSVTNTHTVYMSVV